MNLNLLEEFSRFFCAIFDRPMLQELFRKYQSFLIVALCAAAIAVFWKMHIESPGVEGGMDSYMHYLIAKNSWSNPKLFLDQWGKPLYTIISSPFAQLGMSGLVAFNIICLIGSSLLMYATAKVYGLRYPFFAFLFVLAAPIFFDNIVSGLTEPLNALLLALCLFLFSKQKYAAATILAGFLPYARSEGFVIIAAIGFYLFFIEKNYRIFLLILVGSLVFNLIGWAIESDPFWVITQNPYIKAQVNERNLCGQGSLFHYVKWTHVIFGILSGFLALSGLLYSAFELLSKKIRNIKVNHLFWMSGGIAFLYYAAHSFIWWKGIMGSCGYIRVIVVIVPPVALLAAYGLEKITRWLPRKIVPYLLVLLAGYTIYQPFKRYAWKYPIDISEEQKVYVEVADWIKTKDYTDRTKVYLYPYLSILLDANHYDEAEHKDFWGTSFQFFQKGDIIIWDGHFGPNESDTPLEKFSENPEYKLLKAFKPNPPFKTLNDYDFEVYVFEKIM